MNTLLLLIAILIASETAQGCIDGKVQRLDDGRVNICSSQEWKTVCEKDYQWSVYQANIACRLLGYNNNGANVRRLCLDSTDWQYIDVSECSGTENTFEECGINQRDFADCKGKGCGGTRKRHPEVVCLSADCADGEIRLVGGSSIREGRVEVCMGGRWGTVQNNPQLVEFVCSTLGFPTEGSETVTTFAHGTAPTRSCEIMNNALHCEDITDQSVDELGVGCKTHQEVIGSVINRTIDQTLQTCPEQTTTCVTNQPTTNSKLTMTSGTNQPTTTSEVDQSTLAKEMVGSCPVAALGGLIGLLVVVLLGLAIGLTVTCCVLGKRRSQKQQAEYNTSQRQELSTIQRQLNNPVYDTSMEPHSTYSSSGPTYEQVDNGNQQDHTYSILERDKNTNRHSNQLSAIDEEQNYHVVDSGRCEGVEGAGFDAVYSEASNYEVPMSSKTGSKVWLCEEDYSTLKL